MTNLTAILGQAPDVFEGLPAPDAIFVGGSGRTVPKIVDAAFAHLKKGGRIVATVGSVDNVVSVSEVLRERVGDANVWMINIARGTQQLERLRFESLNPTFLIGTVKE